MNRPILETLSRLHVLDELAELQTRIVEAVEAGHGTGELTLSLKYKREGRGGQLSVLPTVKSKVPVPPYASRIFFVTPDAQLVVDDPRQGSLDINPAADVARIKGAVIND